jgi:carboxyl-terminal processing protease
MKKILYAILILSAGLITACKKDKKVDPTTGPSKTGSALDLIKDSVFLYAQEDYYWHDGLPTYAAFNPRGYTGADDITALDKELNAISQFKINPATNLPYENRIGSAGVAKYSFIDDGTVSAELNGVKGDFGFSLTYNDISDLRIIYVYPGSPADIAGIKRGYRITSINNRTAISYDRPGYGTGTSVNINFVNAAIFNSGTVSMTLTKPDGSTLTVTSLAVANYTVNPVLKYQVFDQGNGHKVGYIVFNSFTSSANANPQINLAFNYFVSQGVTDLVVDLRYNGGGYISTAEYLDNWIVPAAKNGSLMYKTYYTDNLTTGKDPLLTKQVRKDPSNGQLYTLKDEIDYLAANNAVNFQKMGALNVGRVFFIVTGNTASASELTINNLIPQMDVKFIGRTSYGKPVGFFDIDINKYQMYIPEFETKNALGKGGYYTGMNPGSADYPGVNDYDDPTKDFGDPTEALLAHALNYVKTGTFAVKGPVTQGLSARSFLVSQSDVLTTHANEGKFNGMINDKRLRRK